MCDYTFNVDCNASPDYYNLNENFGIIPERNDNEQIEETIYDEDLYDLDIST